MKYLIEIDSLENFESSISDYLKMMMESKYLDGDIDYYPNIEINIMESE